MKSGKIKHKQNKIDLNREYPCPCRRQGKLLPIILTEAMGCDRCQQIFVLTEDQQFIEEVSSSYPYKKVWRWTGKNWRSLYNSWRYREAYLTFSIVIILGLGLVWLPLALRWAGNVKIIFWFIIGVLIAIFPAIIVWLAYRR
jgi:hypothetical protein